MRIQIAHSLIACLVFGLAFDAGTAIAQLPDTFASAAFAPPPNRNAPRSTAGGGSRPGELTCSGQSLDPLQASSQQGGFAVALAPEPFVGLSTQPQPTVWLYLSTPGIQSIEVSLFDEQLKGLSQQTIEINDAVGPVPISLSIPLAASADLSPQQTYYWSAALPCNPNRRTEDWVVGGWIQHRPLASTEAQALASLSPLEQINHYLETGYWYDALANLLVLNDNSFPAAITQASASSPNPLEPGSENLTDRQQTQVETDFEGVWGSLLKQANLINDKSM